jgi:transglutaminase-like putative cysteine protease
MKLAITHETRYDYASPVESAHHVAHLCPLQSPSQTLVSHHLTLEPFPGGHGMTQRTDALGNTLTQWYIDQPHRHLRVSSRSVVITHALPEMRSKVTCLESQQTHRYQTARPADPHCLYAYPSLLVPEHPAFIAYARHDFAPQRPLTDAALALMQRMHRELTYDPDSTQVDTPALSALNLRRGVCQDFAHIMLACLRQMGHAACYVSGYLLTQSAPGQPRLLGGDASHAWVALHIPGASNHPSLGWLHLDPTNQRHGWGSPGPDYVVVAQGRDFADVSPLKGVLRGGSAHQPQVSVSVEPLADADMHPPSVQGATVAGVTAPRVK